MDHLETAALYVALNLLILVWLAMRVVSRRRASQTSLGDGGNPDLERAIRVHGNASEYIPPALIGIVVAALLQGPLWLLHVLGGTLTVGRLMHAFGLGGAVIILRQLGMALTWASIILSAVGLLLLIFGVL